MTYFNIPNSKMILVVSFYSAILYTYRLYFLMPTNFITKLVNDNGHSSLCIKKHLTET